MSPALEVVLTPKMVGHFLTILGPPRTRKEAKQCERKTSKATDRPICFESPACWTRWDGGRGGRGGGGGGGIHSIAHAVVIARSDLENPDNGRTEERFAGLTPARRRFFFTTTMTIPVAIKNNSHHPHDATPKYRFAIVRRVSRVAGYCTYSAGVYCTHLRPGPVTELSCPRA